MSTNPNLTTSDQLNTIMIEAAGDQYAGDPAFTVDVNGVQIGGTYTVDTLYSSGTFEQFTLSGDYGITPGSTVTINYVNDASGAGGDRNLYVGSVTIDGQADQGSVAAHEATASCPTPARSGPTDPSHSPPPHPSPPAASSACWA